MSKSKFWALALAGAFIVPSVSHAQYADAVTSYNPGTGFAAGFTNASAAVGAPALGASVTPFAAPFAKTQIVSIGAGGEITMQFNTPIMNNPADPYGINFLLFANSFFISSGGNVSGLFSHAITAAVQVSQDGSTWYTLNPALAPAPGQLFPTDGAGNPQVPVNPSLTLGNFTGDNLTGIRSLYAGSAGGTGYDLGWAEDTNGNVVNLPDADFIRIEVQSGVLDLDAVSETSPVPETLSTAWLLALVCGGLFWCARKLEQPKAIFCARPRGAAALTSVLALLGMLATTNTRAATITENFTNNPATDGWQVFGDTNLFSWNATNHNLAVTWDSSQPNSYFYHPLGTILGNDDDFQVAFDLEFNDILAGVNTNKSDALEVGIGFLNLGDATGAFVRGAPVFPSASPDPLNVAEFDYFPAFVDPYYGPIDASIAPTIITSDYGFDGAFEDFFTMTNGVAYHVEMDYTASNGTMTVNVTLPGDTNILITAVAALNPGDDYRVDTFSISSYTDIGDPYDSLLAHGWVANVSVTTPPPPVMNITGGFSNQIWQVQFSNRTNWVYTLQRTSDFNSWTAVSAPTPGNGGVLSLQDTNAPASAAYYRVNAQKPLD